MEQKAKVVTAGERARIAAKKAGRLQIGATVPAIAAACGEAAGRGLFSVDVALPGAWFLDKTNQRDLRRALREHDLFALNPRLLNGELVMSISWGDFPPEENLATLIPVNLRKPVILVVNGSSNTGKATLRELAAYTSLYTIRATSRGAPSASLAAELPHVHWISCDLSKDSLLVATKHVEKVFYAAPPAENRVELARNVASAVAANGVQYLVHISVQAIDSRSFTFANQFKDQEELFTASGVPVTHLRCPGFLENFYAVAGSVKSQNTVYWTDLSRGMAFVAVSDIGKAAARLLTRSGAEGVTVDFTGPELVTTETVAATFSEVLGRPITVVTVPIEGYVASLSFLEPWFAKALGELADSIAKGNNTLVSPDGPKLLGSGSKMINLKAWLTSNKQAFE